jgi:hypothetical protein
MVTREAAGVLQPATLSTTEGEPRISLIPSSVREALADPHWRRAVEGVGGSSCQPDVGPCVASVWSQCGDEQVDLETQASS